MKKIFEESYDKYITHMSSMVKDYMTADGYKRRREQCIELTNVFDKIEFPYDK